MSDAPPVEARGLVKRYGEIVAVDHVDLTVEPRRRLRLPRPERRRQDDLAADAARPDPADRGLGAPVRPRPAGRRREGARRRRRVRRGPALLSVPLRPPQPAAARRLRRAERRARGSRRCSRSVELRDRAKDRVGGYSHGMRQRLGIAASLLRAAAAPAARRADDRPRPGGHARHARPRPPARRRGDHDPALEPPALRGRGALQPRRDHPQGRDHLPGRAARPARDGGERLPAARRRARAGARRAVSPSAGVADVALATASSASRADEDAVAALSVALGQARRRVHGARARDGEPRGALPRHDRRRVLRPRPSEAVAV